MADGPMNPSGTDDPQPLTGQQGRANTSHRPAVDDTPEEQPNALQNFIFFRELAEVYLLLDNISTTLGKSLPTPRQRNKRTGDPGEPDWVKEICRISWPPHGSEAELDKQAEILIKARDRLNAVADPATGYTIAFTLMVAGEQAIHESSGGHRRSRMSHGADAALDEDVAAFLRGGRKGQAAPSRLVLANIAYPDLRKRARAFRWFKDSLIYGLIGLFLVTSLLSWNIATGNALLSQLTALETVAAAKSPAPSQTTKPASSQTTKGLDGGAHWKLNVAQDNLRRWSESWHFLDWVLPDMALPDAVLACPTDVDTICPPPNEQWVNTLLSVLGGAVMPILYGALGAGVAVIRSLSDRIRQSQLAPRHLTLFRVQLVLGAVLGGCIGLFATPSSGAPGQAPGLLGSVPLSASALCFLAGFSVEGVFQALDGFIRRVFGLASASGTPASSPALPPPATISPTSPSATSSKGRPMASRARTSASRPRAKTA